MEFGRCYLFGVVLIGLLNIGTFGNAQVLLAPTLLTCPQGYILYNNGYCYDVDECRGLVFPCGQKQLCYNTPGSYVCADVSPGIVAKPGPAVTQKPIQPIPARPVKKPKPAPAAVREVKKTPNTKPCPEGYILYTNGICYDINECNGPNYPCAENEHCVNTAGAYLCTASPTGYAARKSIQKLAHAKKVASPQKKPRTA